jgi:hypothetical protein
MQSHRETKEHQQRNRSTRIAHSRTSQDEPFRNDTARFCYAGRIMAKARKTSAHPTLPLGPPMVTPPDPPQVGDRVIPERSDSEWKITSVRSEGRYVNLELPGTSLTRFNVDVSTLKFTDRVAPKAPPPVRDHAAISERIAVIQRENLQRLDDDIAILAKYLKTEGAPKEATDALDTLSNEQHASWQATVERIKDLLQD